MKIKDRVDRFLKKYKKYLEELIEFIRNMSLISASAVVVNT